MQRCLKLTCCRAKLRKSCFHNAILLCLQAIRREVRLLLDRHIPMHRDVTHMIACCGTHFLLYKSWVPISGLLVLIEQVCRVTVNGIVSGSVIVVGSKFFFSKKNALG